MDEVPKVRRAVQHATTVTRVRGVEVFDGVKKKFRFWNRSSNNIGCYVSAQLSCPVRNLVEGFRGFSSASGLTSFAKRIIHRELVFTGGKPLRARSQDEPLNGISD